MIAIYLRISDKDQNLDGQRAAVQQWLDTHGYSKDIKWFVDIQTGKNLERKEFKALQRAIGSGVVNTVICYKLDRLSRSWKDGVRLIGDWTSRDVRIVSVTQNLDFSGVIGQMIASVLFAVAEIELTHIHERQAAGIAAAKGKGIYKGRKPGTTKAKPERALKLKASGLTNKEIAAALGISPRTVASYLCMAEEKKIPNIQIASK